MPIEKFLLKKGLSTKTIKLLAKDKNSLKINNITKSINDYIKRNETLDITYIDINLANNIPLSNSPINIIYEDDNILIVDKESNLPTTPTYNHQDSLASRVQNYLGNITFRALNRLDLDSTGIIVIAKNVFTENILLNKCKIKKNYVAVVEGKVKKLGKIDAKIMDDTILKKRVVSHNGLTAITYYKRINYNNISNTSVVKCNLKYGRTNQIRCHFSHIGHPLKYDTKYGSKFSNGKFYLRCFLIKFHHPYNNKKIKIKLPYTLSHN